MLPVRRTLTVILALAGMSLATLASAAPRSPQNSAAASAPTSAPAPPKATHHTQPLWWLIGKSIDNPFVTHVMNYVPNSCSTSNPFANILCKSRGFELDTTVANIQGSLVVYQTVFYNNLNTDFSQYPGKLPPEFNGALPLGLRWADTYQDIIKKLGPPSGIDNVSLSYTIYYPPVDTPGFITKIELAGSRRDVGPSTHMADISMYRPCGQACPWGTAPYG